MRTILVADDDERIVAGLAHRLRASGYRVITAPDGFEALKLALAERPDLMLLDIWMPVGVGLSVAQRMDQLGLDIPVVFLTASRLPGLRQSAAQVGGAGFIEKPYDPATLLKTIEEAFELNNTTPAHV